MVDLLKHIGSPEESAARTELCQKIQDLFAGLDITICMDALTSLIVHGAMALGHNREQFLRTLGDAYDAVEIVHAAQERNPN
mgnify:CR=1 FL=1